MRNVFLIGSIVSMIGFPLQASAAGWFSTPDPEPPQFMVSYAGDPDVVNDQRLQLGYPNHIFSIMCTVKECVLNVKINDHTTIKHFPYVQQEWFQPDMKNRPYHSLDIIQSLPSYNGNAELKLGNDPVKNKNLVRVLEQNGWIAP